MASPKDRKDSDKALECSIYTEVFEANAPARTLSAQIAYRRFQSRIRRFGQHYAAMRVSLLVLRCPICRATTPFESLQSLKVNFALVELLGLLGSSGSGASVGAKCQECDSQAATVHCSDCKV